MPPTECSVLGLVEGQGESMKVIGASGFVLTLVLLSQKWTRKGLTPLPNLARATDVASGVGPKKASSEILVLYRKAGLVVEAQIVEMKGRRRVVSVLPFLLDGRLLNVCRATQSWI